MGKAEDLSAFKTHQLSWRYSLALLVELSMLLWSLERRPRSKIPPPASPERERWRAGLGPHIRRDLSTRLVDELKSCRSGRVAHVEPL
jgi:hypothetical protein